MYLGKSTISKHGKKNRKTVPVNSLVVKMAVKIFKNSIE